MPSIGSAHGNGHWAGIISEIDSTGKGATGMPVGMTSRIPAFLVSAFFEKWSVEMSWKGLGFLGSSHEFNSSYPLP